MSKKQPALSAEEQKALAAEAVKRMNDARQAMASSEARENYLDFITNFVACEVGYKTLLKSYLKSRGKPYSDDNLKSIQIRFHMFSSTQISSSTRRTAQQYLTNLSEKQESTKHAA